jgi:hypothetical protein
MSVLERRVPDLATVVDRFDPRIADDELARTQLHLLTASLVLWDAADPADLLDWAIHQARGDGSADRPPTSTTR